MFNYLRASGDMKSPCYIERRAKLSLGRRRQDGTLSKRMMCFLCHRGKCLQETAITAHQFEKK